MSLESILEQFIPADVISEVEPYFEIKELATIFVESGKTTPNKTQWLQIYQRRFPQIYAKLGLTKTKVNRAMLKQEFKDDVMTVFIMLGLISVETIQLSWRNRPNDLNFRLFVQTTDEDWEPFVEDHFVSLLNQGNYSGLVYGLERNPGLFGDNPSIILGRLIYVLLTYVSTYTQFTRHSFTQLLMAYVKIYLQRGYRPLDLLVDHTKDDFKTIFTLLKALIYKLPDLALEYVRDLAPYRLLNIMFLDERGATYLHMAAETANVPLYEAIADTEPLLRTIRNLDDDIPETVLQLALEEMDEQPRRHVSPERRGEKLRLPIHLTCFHLALDQMLTPNEITLSMRRVYPLLHPSLRWM